MSVRIEICWSRISTQLEITTHLERTMTDEQKDTQQRILHILQSKLDAATVALSKVGRYNKATTIQKIHFVGLKDMFEGTVVELEQWQKLFEPSWFQLIKGAPSTVDGKLKSVASNEPRDAAEPKREALKFRRAFDPGRPLFIAEKTLDNHVKLGIPYCTAQVVIDPEDNKRHIIDTVSKEAVKMGNARDLAHRLRDSNPLTFGTMRCKGIVRQSDTSNMSFVFRVPDGYDKIHSFRDLMFSNQVPESLTIRLQLARQLVTAVYYVHLYEFVHKNISPETILTLGKSDEAGLAGSVLCLVGFQAIRYADGKTNTAGLSGKNTLYQHPLRLGDKTVEYMMQHDIYSLGVCLLEIGLWESLMEERTDGTSQVSRNHGLGRATAELSGPEMDKQCLIGLSRGLLRARMGDKYSKVVETCLTCLDEDNLDFGDPREFEDDDGVEVGARYVKKVMDIIATISL